MALSVQPVNNPTLTGVRMSTPADGLGTNTYNPQQAASYIAPSAPAPSVYSAPSPAVSAPAAPTTYYSYSGQSFPSQAAANAANAQAETNYHNNLNAANSTINSGISSGGGDYSSFGLDAFNGAGGFKSQQNSINDAGVQNDLSKIQGMQDIRDMVNNGITGAGVMLDNDAAGTSSAGEAVARAYGIQGRQQASKVGSQYAQGQHTIQTNQDNLSNAEGNFMNVDLPNKKADIINGIVAAAQQSLTYLNAIAGSANLPDQVNIAQQIADIKARATAALTGFDGQLMQANGQNTPTSEDQRFGTANQLHTAGTAPAHQFDYTTQAPATLQNGPAASNLPIYIAPQNKDNTNNTLPITV